uniref:Protein FAR1-RELATED SEQUENCE n=1 Tax=Arundo donax TaxID=35708 RepID=A0A0A9DSN7_ARUDO
MEQVHPRSLITDGDAAMARAIEIVMPQADHRLCSWHIEQNMIKRLRGDALKEFRKLIYHTVHADEFERLWVQFIARHTFKEENKLWLVRLYELRNKWSAAYTKGRHFLGMQSNQRSESLNSRLHNHLDRKMWLIDLVVHYQSCLSSIHRDQLELDAKALNSIPFTDITADVFEKMTALTFTPTMFQKVRDQVRRLYKWEVTEVTWNNGCVRYQVASKGAVEAPVEVTCSFDGSSMVNGTCQCRLFESECIPCGHILCVVRYMQLDTIPECCVSRRWTMQGRNAFHYEGGNNGEVWSEQMNRFHALRKKGNLALFRASRSLEVTERLMKVFDDVIHEDIEKQETTEETSFGPLPAHFAGVYHPSRTKVLDPKKIVSRGAPSLKHMWRAFTEAWKTN